MAMTRTLTRTNIYIGVRYANSDDEVQVEVKAAGETKTFSVDNRNWTINDKAVVAGLVSAAILGFCTPSQSFQIPTRYVVQKRVEAMGKALPNPLTFPVSWLHNR